MSAENKADDAPPTGPPKHNPLSAEHYAGIKKVQERHEILDDAITRAHHIGLDVGEHAAKHERDKAIVARLLAMYPPPPKHHMEK